MISYKRNPFYEMEESFIEKYHVSFLCRCSYTKIRSYLMEMRSYLKYLLSVITMKRETMTNILGVLLL